MEKVSSTSIHPAHCVSFLLKDITPGAAFPPPPIFLFNAVNLSNKFIFGVSDGAATSELWQSDGTPAGTTVFKAFSFANSDFPFIITNYQYDINTGTLTTPLFQGNKFFFTATTDAEGKELKPLHKLIYNKYWVDEIYESFITRPLNMISDALHKLVDNQIVDGVVNGVGSAVNWMSGTIRLAQTGNIGFYIFVMVISIVLILFTQLL